MTVHQIVQKYLNKKRLSSSGFSIRSLAGQVGLSPSFLSRVFRGKKPLSFDLLNKLGPILEIEHEVLVGLQQAYFPAPKPLRPVKKVKTAMTDWNLASLKTLNVLRQWFYLAILEFTTLKDYDGSVQTIASRLGLSETAVEVALREMTALGLLETKKGRLQKTRKKIHWGSSKSLELIRHFHEQMLGQAQIALRRRTSDQDLKERLIAGITLTTSPEKIDDAKRRLNEFMHRLADDIIVDGGAEVYHLSAQLFPLTKTNRK